MVQDLQMANLVLARELVMAHSRAKESISALQQQLADATIQLCKDTKHTVSTTWPSVIHHFTCLLAMQHAHLRAAL